MLNNEIATLVSNGHEQRAISKVGKFGYAIFGPYTSFPAGRYRADFDIKISEDLNGAGEQAIPDDICGFIDVAGEGGKILAHSKLFVSRLAVRQSFSLPVLLDRAQPIEMRVFSTGNVSLSIAPEPSLQPMDAAGAALPILQSATETPPFFVENFAEFLRLYEEGVNVDIGGGGAVTVSIDQTKVLVKGKEDLQIVDEVFIAKSYKFDSPKPKIVVDIGMNIGYASLAFAADPLVRKVYSFEPFATPFKRAIENFALNPQIASKIVPSNFGLAGASRRSTVLVSDTETVSTSIEGLSQGRPETIDIRDVAAVLEPLINLAVIEGLDVFVKVDCEGSEFDIFDSLHAKGLLASIRTLMVEWHKRRSGNKTQRDLMKPLLEHGFVVFDTSRASNLYAGQFNAVRV